MQNDGLIYISQEMIATIGPANIHLLIYIQQKKKKKRKEREIIAPSDGNT